MSVNAEFVILFRFILFRNKLRFTLQFPIILCMAHDQWWGCNAWRARIVHIVYFIWKWCYSFHVSLKLLVNYLYMCFCFPRQKSITKKKTTHTHTKELEQSLITSWPIINNNGSSTIRTKMFSKTMGRHMAFSFHIATFKPWQIKTPLILCITSSDFYYWFLIHSAVMEKILKDGHLRDLFSPDLDPPLFWSCRKSTDLVNDLRHLLHAS